MTEQLKILKPSFKKVSKFFEELEKKGKNGYSTKDTEEANIKEQETTAKKLRVNCYIYFWGYDLS